MLDTLLASQAGQRFAGSFGGSLGAGLGNALGGGGPLVSGASVDGRGFLDGSGWTVATGSSRATGGTSGGLSAPGRAPDAPDYGATPTRAGAGLIGGLLLVSVAAWWIARGGWRS